MKYSNRFVGCTFIENVCKKTKQTPQECLFRFIGRIILKKANRMPLQRSGIIGKRYQHNTFFSSDHDRRPVLPAWEAW